MVKFFGKVGFGTSVKTAPGVWADNITEHDYYGDVVRQTRDLRDGEHLNKDITVNNSISIVADAYANQNYYAIKYVLQDGVRWTVDSVEVQRPRLILNLGGVYNGPTP